MDIAAPPLVPVGVKTVPITPPKKAYPDDWQQAGYQAQFSPDKTLMALGVEDGAGYVKQVRSEEHTSELQSLMRISYAVFCLKKKTLTNEPTSKQQYDSKYQDIQLY